MKGGGWGRGSPLSAKAKGATDLVETVGRVRWRKEEQPHNGTLCPSGPTAHQSEEMWVRHNPRENVSNLAPSAAPN